MMKSAPVFMAIIIALVVVAVPIATFGLPPKGHAIELKAYGAKVKKVSKQLDELAADISWLKSKVKARYKKTAKHLKKKKGRMDKKFCKGSLSSMGKYLDRVDDMKKQVKKLEATIQDMLDIYDDCIEMGSPPPAEG